MYRRRSRKPLGVPRRRKRVIRRTRRRRLGRIKRYTTATPSYQFVKLNYSYTGAEMALATFTVNRVVYRLNGMFDPDLTGAGHQPYYYDQWSAMYQNYKVYGCKVVVRVAMHSGGTKPAYLALWANPSSDITITNPDQMIETFGSKFVMVPSDQSSRTISRYYKIPSIFGVSRIQYSTDPNYMGRLGNVGTGTDPTYVAAVAIMGYSGLTCTLNMDIKLTYYAKVYGRQNNTIS